MRTDPKPFLDLLASVIEDRAEDIRRITATGYSWESWLQWEWWLRCRARDEWTVRFEPLYRGYGGEECNNVRADLLLGEPGESLPALVELAVVHSENAAGWLKHGKLEKDLHKLSGLDGRRAFGVQVVVVTSTSRGVESSPWWRKLLDASRVWSREPGWSATMPMDSGEAIVRAWW